MNITEFQLRTTLIDYIMKNTAMLNHLLKSWNDRLSQGISVAPNLLYDLVGKDLEYNIIDKLVHEVELSERSARLTVGIWVDRKNPFYVTFAYKIITSDIPNEKVLFTLGEEQHLLGFWEEMIEQIGEVV